MKKITLYLLIVLIQFSFAAFSQTKPKDPCDKATVTKLPGQFLKPSEINTGSAFSSDVANERKIMNYIYSIIAAAYQPVGLKANNQFNFFNTNKTSWNTKINNQKHGSDYTYDVYNFRYQCQSSGFYIDGHFDFSLSFLVNEGNIYTDSVPVIDYEGKLYRNKPASYNALPNYWVKKNGQLTQLENGHYYSYSDNSSTKHFEWLITKDGKLPFNYVTRREFLQKMIRFNQAYLKELRKNNSSIIPSIENVVKSYTADLQKSESWLNEISIVTSQYNSEGKFSRYNFVTPTQSDALVLMQPNPEYEDKKRPASAPQYIRIYLKINNDHPEAKNLITIIQKNIDKFIALVQTGVPGQVVDTKEPEFVGVVKDKKTSAPDAGSLENVDYTFKPLAKLDKPATIVYPAGFKSALPAPPQNSNKMVAQLPAFKAPAPSAMLGTLGNTAPTDKLFQKQIDDIKALVAAKITAANTTKVDGYLKQKNISTSLAINNYAIEAWTSGKPTLALYLFCKAMQTNYSDMNTANNLASLLISYGYAEKAIPILQYINTKATNAPVVLANMATAYYNLGDMTNAASFAAMCIAKDSLNANANKVAAFVHLNKATQTGNKAEAEKAIGCLKQSLKSQYNQEASDLLNKIESGHNKQADYYNTNFNAFPLLKRLELPAMPTDLAQMKSFNTVLKKERSGISKTREEITAKQKKIPAVSAQQRQTNLMKQVTASIKAGMIITNSALQYNKQFNDAEAIFKLNLKQLTDEHNRTTNGMLKKYTEQLDKLEGGEGKVNEEIEIELLTKARCNEFNGAQSAYLSKAADLTNKYAQQSEYLSRTYWRDYANWKPLTEGDNSMAAFLYAQKGYLMDVDKILSNYPEVLPCTDPNDKTKTDNTPSKPKPWEEEYCANFKGNVGLGVTKIGFNCSSMSISGGEGFVGELNLNYNEDGSFKELTLGAGVGVEANWGNKNIAALSMGVSAMNYVTVGQGPQGMQVTDWGVTAGASAGANVGNVSGEANLASATLSATEGIKTGGAVTDALKILKGK